MRANPPLSPEQSDQFWAQIEANMTLMECYEQFSGLIHWHARRVLKKHPDEDFDELVHAGLIHFAKYSDRYLPECRNLSALVGNLTRWGMLKHIYKDKKRQKHIRQERDFSGYSAVPSSRYVPDSEKIKYSIARNPDPTTRIYCNELMSILNPREAMYLRALYVIGLDHSELAEFESTGSKAIFAVCLRAKQKIAQEFGTRRARKGWKQSR